MGGARIRVYSDAGSLKPATVGRLHKAELERLQKIVMSLSPQGAGLMHFFHVDGKHWKVDASGMLAEDGFDQRVRNILTNS